MPKSGKERKAKRRAKQQVEALLPSHWVPANKREEQENNQLIKQALRWKTNMLGGCEEEVFNKEVTDKLTTLDLALLVTRRNLLSQDPKISNIAAKNIIAMEAQNQRDQLKPDETTHQHLHIHQKTKDDLKKATNSDILEVMAIRHRLQKKQNG